MSMSFRLTGKPSDDKVVATCDLVNICNLFEPYIHTLKTAARNHIDGINKPLQDDEKLLIKLDKSICFNDVFFAITCFERSTSELVSTMTKLALVLGLIGILQSNNTSAEDRIHKFKTALAKKAYDYANEWVEEDGLGLVHSHLFHVHLSVDQVIRSPESSSKHKFSWAKHEISQGEKIMQEIRRILIGPGIKCQLAKK